MPKILSDLLGCLVFVGVIVGFIIYYWLKMATKGLDMVSNIMFDIFGTFQMSTKSGTLDPFFITETLQQIQEYTNSFQNMFSDYGNLKFQNVGNCVYQSLGIPDFSSWNCETLDL